MNRIRQSKEAAIPEKKNPGTSALNGGRKFIEAINIFGYFDQQGVVRMMPYIFFLTFLALIYIGNTYYAERTIRDIDRTERELKELHSEFITAKSELMYRSKLSEVAVAISTRDLTESTVAPRKIMIRKPVAVKGE